MNLQKLLKLTFEDLSDNTISELTERYSAFRCYQIDELTEPVEDLFVICGTIKEVQQIPTSKNPNKHLRFITMKDFKGEVTCVCFDNKLQNYHTILEQDNNVIVTGKISQSNKMLIVIESAEKI